MRGGRRSEMDMERRDLKDINHYEFGGYGRNRLIVLCR
jgi:hypothetical protein